MAKSIFLITCLAAFLAPFAFSTRQPIPPDVNLVEFPNEFEGRPLKNIGLSSREEVFFRDFPGQIGRFSDGEREIIIRRVTEPTRMLHPAGDCFQAIGFSTYPLPLKVGSDGKRWSCFAAARGDEQLNVCERIENHASNEWTDVSSWYWSTWGTGKGEWWAFTVAERRYFVEKRYLYGWLKP